MKKNRPTLVEKAQIQGYHANRRHFAKTITGQDPAYRCRTVCAVVCAPRPFFFGEGLPTEHAVDLQRMSKRTRSDGGSGLEPMKIETFRPPPGLSLDETDSDCSASVQESEIRFYL